MTEKEEIKLFRIINEQIKENKTVLVIVDPMSFNDPSEVLSIMRKNRNFPRRIKIRRLLNLNEEWIHLSDVKYAYNVDGVELYERKVNDHDQ